MAAEYGVIGEISRGSSTAANARKRCLSSRCLPSPPPSLFLPRSIFCHSTLVDATVFSFLPILILHLSLSFFPSIVLVLWICKRSRIYIYMYIFNFSYKRTQIILSSIDVKIRAVSAQMETNESSKVLEGGLTFLALRISLRKRKDLVYIPTRARIARSREPAEK